MTTITIRASGPRAPDQAWERYARPALWSSWSPQIRRVECASQRLGPGVTGRVFGPLGLSAGFVVDEWDDASRRWAWTVRFGPVHMALSHGVDAADGGCTTWLTARAAAPVVLGYLPAARLALHRLVH